MSQADQLCKQKIFQAWQNPLEPIYCHGISPQFIEQARANGLVCHQTSPQITKMLRIPSQQWWTQPFPEQIQWKNLACWKTAIGIK